MSGSVPASLSTVVTLHLTPGNPLTRPNFLPFTEQATRTLETLAHAVEHADPAALPAAGVDGRRRLAEEPMQQVGLVRVVHQQRPLERGLMARTRVDEGDVGTHAAVQVQRLANQWAPAYLAA